MARPPELCAGESRDLGIVASEGQEGASGHTTHELGLPGQATRPR